MSDTLNKELSETVQDRLQALQELTEFTENCEAKLKALFESLGWDQEWSENISKVTSDLFCFRPQSIFLVNITVYSLQSKALTICFEVRYTAC